MNCPKCESLCSKNGTTKFGKQKYICRSCRYNFEADKTDTVAPQLSQEPNKTEQSVGLTEAQMRAKYDIRFIIATRCKELKQGVFLTRSEFINFCGIRPGQGYTDVINHPDYDNYRGKVTGVVYYSHPDSIRKLKSEGVLT